MIGIVLAVAAAMAASLYVLGAAWVGYRAARVAPAWLREHPESLGGPVRRALTVPGLALLWPLALLALGWTLWSERQRCPLGECALSGWHTPGTPTRAPIGVYRCPHRPPEPTAARTPYTAGRDDRDDDEHNDHHDAIEPGWHATFLGCVAAMGVGALAAIPIPYPGYLAVSAVVAFASTEPLAVIFQELLAQGAARSNRC